MGYLNRVLSDALAIDNASSVTVIDPSATTDLQTKAPDHMMLLNAGATKQGAWLKHGGQSIRVVNGAGQGLSDVQGRYKEPTTVPQSEIVVCAGAIEFGVPGKIIPSGRGASMVRPASGGGAKWLTLERAKMELGL